MWYNILWNYNEYISYIIYILIIILSIITLTRNNPMLSILFMIKIYVLVAIYLYLNGLAIIGLLYLLIYVGAISILFLFILSLIDLKESELLNISSRPDILILFTVYILFILNILWLLEIDNISSILFNTPYQFIINILSDNIIYNQYITLYNNWYTTNTTLELAIIGKLLYTEYAFIFILLGIILLLSIIAAILLIYKSKSRFKSY